MLCVAVVSTSVTCTEAQAQVPLTLPGGDKKEDAPDVRLVDDPRQQVQREKQALKESLQTLSAKQGDEVQRWTARIEALEESRKALVVQRQKLILAKPPTEDERLWTVPTIIEDPDELPTPDAAVPDAAVPDAAVPDADLDGGVDGGADAGVDGGVDGGADAALDAGVSPDAGSADGGVDLDGGLGTVAELIPDSGLPDAMVPDAVPPDAALQVVVLPVIQAPEAKGYLTPETHPAEVQEIDRLLASTRRLEGMYSQVRRVLSAQHAVIEEGINKANTLLEQMEAAQKAEGKTNEGKDTLFAFKEVELLARDVHLARIEVSLAKAKLRRGAGGGDGDQDDIVATVQALPKMASLEGPEIEPVDAFTDSYKRAGGYRSRNERMRQEQARLAGKLAEYLEPLRKARARRARLELLIAERALADQEKNLTWAMDHMDFGPSTVEYAENIFKRSMGLREKNIPVLEEKLDMLRSQVSGGLDDNSNFSRARLLELQRTDVDEHIHFEREKLLRDTFRLEMVKVIRQVLRGSKIPEPFTQRFNIFLDPKAMAQRQKEREARCDGWRRAQNSDSKKKAETEALEKNKKQLIETYESLADVCMRMEWVQGTEERLGDIARYHFERLAWQARGFWWYAWRTLVTLMLMALTVYLTRWVMRITHWIAGTHNLTDGAPTKNATGLSGYGNQQDASPLVTPDTKAALNAGPAADETLFQAWVRVKWPRLRNTLGLLTYLAGIGGLWLAAGVLTAEYVWLLPVELASLLEWATSPLFMVGENEVSLWSLAQLAVWVVAAVYIGRLLQVFISDHLLDHFRVDRGLRDAIGTISRYIVVALGIALGLAAVGIGLGALAVVFGVIGIGIGFGLQNIASNFISGFILLIERPIRKGDFVQVGDMVGEVKNISARATIIETRDAVTVIVPNAEFVSGRVVNWTLGSGERVRSQVVVGVAYGTEVHLVRRLLLQAARAHPGVLKSPRPWVEMTGFGDSSLDFKLHVWTRRIRGLPGLISDLRQSVDALFREHEIEIPYPQRDINVRSAMQPPLGQMPEDGGLIIEEQSAEALPEPAPEIESPVESSGEPVEKTPRKDKKR
ncbi:MAG: mechanosensitive ion channel domain-containing protein [Bradymonadia bacterium]